MSRGSNAHARAHAAKFLPLIGLVGCLTSHTGSDAPDSAITMAGSMAGASTTTPSGGNSATQDELATSWPSCGTAPSSSTACRRTCSAVRSTDTPFYAFDTSTCEQRPLQPCAAGGTAQSAADGMLAGLVDAAIVGQLYEDSLLVDFEGGCPTRLHTSLQHRLEHIEALLEVLGGARWACALDLQCAAFAGPSTLATP